MSSEESSLAERARAGSRAAFGGLVAIHQHGVYGYVLRIIGDAEAAADVTQDVFLRAYTALADLRDARKFKPWLYAIAVSASRNWLRRQRRAPLSLDGSSPEAADGERELPDPSLLASPSLTADANEARQLVRRAVESLPAKYREVAVLRFQHEMKVSEVADALHINVAAVESRLRRAKAMLRDRLAELK